MGRHDAVLSKWDQHDMRKFGLLDGSFRSRRRCAVCWELTGEMCKRVVL